MSAEMYAVTSSLGGGNDGMVLKWQMPMFMGSQVSVIAQEADKKRIP